eukprot:NODE_693_length_1250_cov_59.185679_g554_i0.p1 GENE.NODE_693_length_1250_cov_59.185679_g554_i0~~NODE_693_length_1250_cov_59.185679_g554_i0.p1  ORF type:complete len:341 (+),score=21.12 NODE_693_length_1250_cov_59.185679_g554_i0:95-1117(+)
MRRLNKMLNSPAFSVALPERAAHMRALREKMQEFLHSPQTRFMVFRGGEPLVEGDEASQLSITWMDSGFFRSVPAESVEPVFLGLDETNCPYFAFALPDSVPPESLPRAAKFLESKKAARCMPRKETGMVAQARSLLEWHKVNRFCALCGSPTKCADGGHKRLCSNADCATHKRVINISFPRTDPCVIMLIHDGGDRCLLARHARSRGQVYSCLAGFIEVGETIEAACAREVREETGVIVEENSIQYVTSQPWPFPASLMLGMIGRAKPDGLNFVIDRTEIKDAIWANRRDVLTALQFAQDVANADKEENPALPFILPLPVTISHHLIARWAAADPESKL